MLTHRLATQSDTPALGELMHAAIERLQEPFLDAHQIAASHQIMGIDTQLIVDGTYYVVESEGKILGCGGWSRRATMYGGDHTAGRDARLLDPHSDAGRVRAMYTHPDHVRRGVGRRILEACEGAAAAEGFARLELVATLSGHPLYRQFGFQTVEAFTDTSTGVDIPLVKMAKPVFTPRGALHRYWDLYDGTADDLVDRAAACIAPDIVFQAARMDTPVLGFDAVVAQIRSIRDWVTNRVVAHSSVQWSGRTASWCWSVSDGTTASVGMDVADVDDDNNIRRIIVFNRCPGMTSPD